MGGDSTACALAAGGAIVPPMTTLADIRDRVRNDLRDLETDALRWSDAELDRHIARGLAELNLAAPREARAVLATTAGSRELATSALPGFIALEAVELPVDAFPRRLVPFSVWAGTVTLELRAPPKGERARLSYLAAHTLDASGSTLPAGLEDVLAGGAAGYAAIARASFAIDRLNAGEAVAERFRSWGEARLRAFHELLREQGRARRLRGRRLSPPA